MLLLLPVYQPSAHLAVLLDEVRAAAPDTRVVVVDDGSASAPVPDVAAARGGVVLRHGTNRGKGAALKTGIGHVARSCPGVDVVCADADGQHGARDILRVAERVERTRRIVLGVRDVGRKMPLRSRFGNTVTQSLFRAATGRAVRDTQTGLRGYPAELLDWLLAIPGERFEYEMNVLLYATRAGHPIEQVPIDTTYLGTNASSHFGSFSDATRIYRQLLRFAARRGTRSACGVEGRGEQRDQNDDHAAGQLGGLRPGVAAARPGGASRVPGIPPGGVGAAEAVTDDDDGGRGQYGGDAHCGTRVVRHAEPPGDA